MQHEWFTNLFKTIAYQVSRHKKTRGKIVGFSFPLFVTTSNVRSYNIDGFLFAVQNVVCKKMGKQNLTTTIPRLIIQRDHLRKEPRTLDKKFPVPLPPLPKLGKVVDLESWWYKNRPAGTWLTVDEWGKIVSQVIVYHGSNAIDHIEFPEGYGALCLPWVPGSDARCLLAGRHEDLEKILEAYNLLHHARTNFFEKLRESLEE